MLSGSLHDDDSTGGGSTTVRNSVNRPEHEQRQAREILSSRETRAVNGLRYVVTILLAVTAILVSGGLYLFMKNDQKGDFENEFSGYAGRIVANFDRELERKLAAFDALASSYTSHSLASGNKFPNVTLPHADIRGANTRILGDTVYFQWGPLVTDENRAGWEAYAAENEKRLDEAFFSELDQKARQDARFNLTTPGRRDLTEARDLQLDGYKPKIYGFGDYLPPRPEGSGPFFVYWQVSPVMQVKSLLNFDFLVFSRFQVRTQQQTCIKCQVFKHAHERYGRLDIKLTTSSSTLWAARQAQHNNPMGHEREPIRRQSELREKDFHLLKSRNEWFK